MPTMSDLRKDLRIFIEFSNENRLVPLETIVASCVKLVAQCPASRDAILTFYSHLFDEYSRLYLEKRARSSGLLPPPGPMPPILIPPTTLLGRFLEAASVAAAAKDLEDLSSVGGRMRKSSMESVEEMRPDGSGPSSETPRSPPRGIPTSGPGSLTVHQHRTDDKNLSLLWDSLPEQIELIHHSLVELIQDRDTSREFARRATNWSLTCAAMLSAKYPWPESIQATSISPDFLAKFNSPESLERQTEFYAGNIAVRSLVSIVRHSRNVLAHSEILSVLVPYAPFADWIIATLYGGGLGMGSSSASIASNDSTSDCAIAECMSCLLSHGGSSPSATRILAYLSERNPRAIIRASKSNVPFLLKLCSNSQQLLNLVTKQLTDEVDIQTLNDLSENKDMENMDRHIMECIMRAENSVQLLFTAFNVIHDERSVDKLSSRAVQIIESIFQSIYTAVFESTSKHPDIVIKMKDHLDKLAHATLYKSNPTLRSHQIKLMKSIAIASGFDAYTKLVFHLVNQCDQETCSSDLLVDDIIQPLAHSVRLALGGDIFKFTAKVMDIQTHAKSANFWENYHLVVTHPEFRDHVKLNLDHLTDFFTEIMLESHENEKHYDQVLNILQLIVFSLEKCKATDAPRLDVRLCNSLAVNYFSLVESLHENSDSMEEEKAMTVMKCLIVAQKAIHLLASWCDLNQMFICRSLLDLAVVSNQLFSSVLSNRAVILDSEDAQLNLLSENRQLEGSHSMKFRKIALVPKAELLPSDKQKRINENNQMNRQAGMDAFRAAIVDMKSFASLFMDCVTPDVMFNDQFWPDEEYLKVTIERDLAIYRRFESNPLMWDLLEHISQAGLLEDCSLIIRALLAVQLTQWGAATPAMDGKLESTQRLLGLIAEGGLIPPVPCKFLPEVIPILKSWEIHCLLTDIYRYLREVANNPSPETMIVPIRPFLERLRVIMSNAPGPEFVKIFKPLLDQ